ncbi:MAG: 3-phosphoserine/phosphohydroxythreonine transaminase, partial [Clostridia bacterium]|nr:3-phosphoserine/phosphohydroxythreonine transaminase [Clostridia bacterium]
MRVFNFSAGPSMLPEAVLQEIAAEMTDYNGTGMSVTEMSHRSKPFQAIIDETEADLRQLMNVPDDYYVLFVQGGASTQFEAVPLNLTKKGKADYIVTGNFANKAFEEAAKYTDAYAAASSKEANYTYIPRTFDFREGTDYVHITTNNTIFGTRYTFLPETDAPLVADMSSNILSEKTDVSRFGVIYAGAQKNLAPAGVTVVIAKKELVDGGTMDICPTMLKWKTQAKNGSLYNTPPCFSIYAMGKVLKWLKQLGGAEVMQQINERKAKKLYDFIDQSSFYTNRVAVADRSLMNVPFVTASEELDAKFIKEAAACGLVSLKGHRLVGGMRASIYN